MRILRLLLLASVRRWLTSLTRRASSAAAPAPERRSENIYPLW